MSSARWKIIFVQCKNFLNFKYYVILAIPLSFVHINETLGICIFYFNTGRAVQLFTFEMESCTLLVASHFFLSHLISVFKYLVFVRGVNWNLYFYET